MTPDRVEVGSQWPPAKSEDEWLLFCLRGLTFAQIARLCCVNAETVRYSIRQREAIDPTIAGRRLVRHDQPRYMVPRGPRDRAWNRRYTTLFQFVAEQGRFPKQLGGPVEKGLERWLYTQRVELAAGELEPGREQLLDALGEWR